MLEPKPAATRGAGQGHAEPRRCRDNPQKRLAGSCIQGCDKLWPVFRVPLQSITEGRDLLLVLLVELGSIPREHNDVGDDIGRVFQDRNIGSSVVRPLQLVDGLLYPAPTVADAERGTRCSRWCRWRVVEGPNGRVGWGGKHRKATGGAE